MPFYRLTIIFQYAILDKEITSHADNNGNYLNNFLAFLFYDSDFQTLKEITTMKYTGRKFTISVGAMPFATISNTRSQFRIIANLDKDVDPEILQKATDLVVPRFPMYTVIIRRRWHGLRTLQVADMKVNVEPFNPQREHYHRYAKKPLFKIMYEKNMICVELYHILTDGNGGVRFLNCLLACYFTLLGEDVDMTNILDWRDHATDEEFEDGYLRFAENKKGKINNARSFGRAQFKLDEKVIKDRGNVSTTYSFDLASAKPVAKSYGATLHEYLAATLCVTFLRLRDERGSKKCIRLQMPIDLRKRFPTTTLTNFVATTQFETFGGDKAQLIKELREHFEIATHEDELKSFLNDGKNLMHGVLGFLPRFISDFLVDLGDTLLGERMSNTSFSNLGLVKNNLAKNGVLDYEVIGGNPLYAPFYVTAISFNGICNISFSRHIESDVFERYFLEELSKDDISPTKTVIRK